MPQRLHLAFGGALSDPAGTTFRDAGAIDISGKFSGSAATCEAWTAAAHRAVDHAHLPCFDARMHRAPDAARPGASTEDFGA